MSFIPKQHSDALKAGGSRNDYLSPSKVKADGQVRFAILANEPLCYFEVWGEDETGKGKPFRFAQEATADEIDQEMGANYKRRLKDDGTEEPQKFAGTNAAADTRIPNPNLELNIEGLLSRAWHRSSQSNAWH